MMGDAMTSAPGFGVAPTPWQAVQRAAWAGIDRTFRVIDRN
jgi:hypothetical protein